MPPELPMLNLPRVAQTLDYTCGAACFESLFRYFKGASPGEMHFARELGALELGYTSPDRVVTLARQCGFHCDMRKGAQVEDLAAALMLGLVVFVTWWDEDAGHYSLVKHLARDHILLMDPWLAREGRDNLLPVQDFVRHWHSRGGRMIRVGYSPG